MYFSAARFNVALRQETLSRPPIIRVQVGFGRRERIRIEDRVAGGKYWILAHPARLAAQSKTVNLFGILTEMGYGAPREGNAHRPRLADEGAPVFTWRGCTFSRTTPRGYTQATHDVSLIMMIDGDRQSRR